MRNLIFLLIFTLIGTPAVAEINESILTGKTLIHGDVITVGDLFTNAGRNAGHVLAPAPRVGDKLVLTKNDLQRVVSAFRLNWKSSDTAPISVVLERDAVAVTQDQITAALHDSELKNSVNADAQFKLTNVIEDIVVDGQAPVDLAVRNATYDAGTEKFTAQMDIKRNNEVVKTIALEGIATDFVKVPVLRYPVMSSNALNGGDIIEITIPKNQMRSDYVTSKAELENMTAKRSLMPNQPISRQDVTPPVMVKRNELVTVTYKSGPIQLTAKARSLGAGTRGDTVTLMNLTSKKSFEAKVTGPQQAEVNSES